MAERIGGWVTDAKARDRVEAGLVDPCFSRLRKQIDDGWAPTFRDIGGGEAGKLGAAKDFLTSYTAQAERYGKTGDPYPEGVQPSDPHGRLARGPLEPDRAPPLELFGLEISGGGRDALLDMVGGRMGGRQVMALVLVDHGPRGARPRARIVESSGYPDFDRQAREGAERAAGDVGPRPPAELILLVRIAFENLLAHRLKTLIIAGSRGGVPRRLCSAPRFEAFS